MIGHIGKRPVHWLATDPMSIFIMFLFPEDSMDTCAVVMETCSGRTFPHDAHDVIGR